jgi:hypothetical protein
LGLFRPLWPSGYPPYIFLYYFRTVRRSHQLAAAIGFGVLFGVMSGLLINVPLLGFLDGLVCGAAACLVATLSAFTPRRSRVASPQATMRVNQRNAIVAAAQQGLIAAIIFAISARFVSGAPSALTAGFTAGAIYALAAASAGGLWTWARFRLIHILLAAYGLLPWRLWRFLNDAHRHGLLRQAGTSWQFRHTVLQDHLAEIARLKYLRRMADADDWRAAERLAVLLAAQDRVDELRTRADSGDRYAAERLANLLIRQALRQGRIDDAIAILNRQVAAGSLGALERLAGILARHGRANDAIAVLRPLAENGDSVAARSLAGLLAGQGSVDEAIAILRPAASAHGMEVGAVALDDLLTVHGRIDQLRARAEGGDSDAARRLAGLLARQGRVDDAIATLRTWTDAGVHQREAEQLADLLIAQGRIDDLRARAEGGDLNAADRLALHLAQQGKVNDAIAILQPLADTHVWTVANKRLAELLALHGYIDELRVRAERDGFAKAQLVDYLAQEGCDDELWTLAESGDSYADKRVTELLARQGRFIDVAHLRPYGRGSPDDDAQLADLLATQGRVDEAIAILRSHRDTNQYRYVADKLNELLASHGRIDELRARADAGDHYASTWLAKLIAKQGDIDELRALADADEQAAKQLNEILAQRGLVDELYARANAGDWHAVHILADLLTKQSREPVEPQQAHGRRSSTE